ncbi:hypothetical protein ABZ464_24335 [Streptomyces sp. NPDC005820]|uniref:hypothetical protein n=1 Tax=Streptomyces sp. NPDC005820 TaxID=3157069 RepID=UPI0033C0E7F4
MDVRFAGEDGGFDGVEAVRRLASVAPATPVVMLTSYSGRADVVRGPWRPAPVATYSRLDRPANSSGRYAAPPRAAWVSHPSWSIGW